MRALAKNERWASVNRRDWPHVGAYRHVVTRGAVTSACGTTALPATLWRGTTSKPVCPNCVQSLSQPVPVETLYPVTAESVYAQLRREKRLSLDPTYAHLVPQVRYRAKRDGLSFGTARERLASGQGMILLVLHEPGEA